MYCIKCGTKIEEGQKFCMACGEKVDYTNKIENNRINKDGVYSEEKADTVDSVTAEPALEEIGNASSEEKTILEQYQEATNSNVKKERPARKRKKLLILACLVLVAALVAVATVYSGYAQQKKQKEEYLLEAETFGVTLMPMSVGFTEFAADATNYWWEWIARYGDYYGGAYIEGTYCSSVEDAIMLADGKSASYKKLRENLDSIEELYAEFEQMPIPEGKTSEETQKWRSLQQSVKTAVQTFRKLGEAALFLHEGDISCADYADDVSRYAESFMNAHSRLTENIEVVVSMME